MCGFCSVCMGFCAFSNVTVCLSVCVSLSACVWDGL